MFPNHCTAHQNGFAMCSAVEVKSKRDCLLFRDAPIPIPGIGIGRIRAKKGVSVSVVEHEYCYR